MQFLTIAAIAKSNYIVALFHSVGNPFAIRAPDGLACHVACDYCRELLIIPVIHDIHDRHECRSKGLGHHALNSKVVNHESRCIPDRKEIIPITMAYYVGSTDYPAPVINTKL